MMGGAVHPDLLGRANAMALESESHPLAVSLRWNDKPADTMPLTAGLAEYLLLSLLNAMAETGKDPMPLLRRWKADRDEKAAGYPETPKRQAGASR